MIIQSSGTAKSDLFPVSDDYILSFGSANGEGFGDGDGDGEGFGDGDGDGNGWGNGTGDGWGFGNGIGFEFEDIISSFNGVFNHNHTKTLSTNDNTI